MTMAIALELDQRSGRSFGGLGYPPNLPPARPTVPAPRHEGSLRESMSEAAIGAEDQLIARLRRGDEAAFVELVERHGPALLRVARMYCTESVAEEVVQETWIGVLNGLDRFEGRASLRTWIFRILANIARTRGEREHRQVPFSAFANPSADAEPAVDPDRFNPPGTEWANHWISHPRRWDELPEVVSESSETVAVARRAIDALPPAQRDVITLRDVEGWSSEEVCASLSLSAVNQRVLLHRARAKVRAALEQHLEMAR